MKNYKNNHHKRNKYRNNGDRNFQRNGNGQNIGSDFTNNSSFKRKNLIRNNFNIPKLIEKYTNFAKEALSNGDKIQYENYLQHADHFLRLQADREKIKKKDENNITANNHNSETVESKEVNEKIETQDTDNIKS